MIRSTTLSLEHQVRILLGAREDGLRLPMLAAICAVRAGNTPGNLETITESVHKCLSRLARRGEVERDAEDPSRWRLA